MGPVFRLLKRILREKRGSSTMEYVVILAAGLLLATLLFQVLQGDEVKNAIRTAVENAILGRFVNDPANNANNAQEGSRSLSDMPDPLEIPEPVADSNNPTDRGNPSEKSDRLHDFNDINGFREIFSIAEVLPQKTFDPRRSLADIAGLKLFGSKWSVADLLICSQGLWECQNREDIKRDLRDLNNNPLAYMNDVVGLDKWISRLEKVRDIDYRDQWRDFVDDPGGYLRKKWKFTADRMKDWWRDVSRDPGKYAGELLLDALGWYDAQAWATGIDPQTGERLRIPNRKLRLALMMPLPQTKWAKVGKMGIDKLDKLADFAIDLACAERKGKGGCKDDSKNGWSLAKGGAIINGRKYTRHALERMAPDIPEVREELERRALEKGYSRGSNDFNRYVQPRGIPPMVVEYTIQKGASVRSRKEEGLWLHWGEDILVVTNDNGDVVSVHKITEKDVKKKLKDKEITEDDYKMIMKKIKFTRKK